MPHYCTKCGAVVADNSTFCASCGAPQPVTTVSGGQELVPPMNSASGSQMSQNLAATLSYALGWLTGLIFYLIDKRPYVRFHAAQSIVVFGALHILTIIIGIIFGVSFVTGGWIGFSLGRALYRLLDIVAFVLWIILMVKAYQGDRFRVPFAADAAERIFGRA